MNLEELTNQMIRIQMSLRKIELLAEDIIGLNYIHPKRDREKIKDVVVILRDYYSIPFVLRTDLTDDLIVHFKSWVFVEQKELRRLLSQ